MTVFGIPPALSDAVGSLKEAVDAGRTDIFRKILETCETCDGGGIEERKQLVNSFATEEGTFLHKATKLGHVDIVRALLAADADPGIIDKEGHTPIQICPSSALHAVFIEELLRATAKSETGRVCQLIASGVDVNAHDNSRSENTALHWAASFADADTVNCLIDRGADVNIFNAEGQTPIHDAVKRGHLAIAEALLQGGANVHIEFHKGDERVETPFEATQNKPEMRSLFLKYSSVRTINGFDKPAATNGSISPIFDKALTERVYSSESLVSMGKDSVMSSNVDNTSLKERTSKPEQNFSNIPGKENGEIGHHRSSSIARSPLQSSSSLEISPIIEQVCERLAAVQMTSRPPPLIINSALHNMWPQPKKITELTGPVWKVPSVISLAVVNGPITFHRIVDVWNIHKPEFKNLGFEVQLTNAVSLKGFNKSSATVLCTVDDRLVLGPEQYSLTIREEGVRLICGSLSSLHYALVTFAQILRVFNKTQETTKDISGRTEEEDLFIPQLSIVDYPSIPNRGFMLDMSPATRIPKLERIYEVVDTLVSLKLNQLHLFFKITSSFHSVSLHSIEEGNLKCQSYIPFSSSELISLERYCADRGLTLVPCFDMDTSESSNFCLSDISVALRNSMSNFPSAQFVHFGPNLTSLLADLCNNSTQMSSWAQLHIPDSVILMVCGNVFRVNRHGLKFLPLSSILIEYGFQADYDFSAGCRLANEEGRALAVCPGTSAWSSLSGWPEAGVSNTYRGVLSSLESGANWILIANWSNTPSFTPLAFAWAPLLVAAGLSWNHTTHWDFVHSSLGSLMDLHLMKVPDCGLGDALIELGRCETWITRVARGQGCSDPTDLPSCLGSTLHQLLIDPDSVHLDYLNVEAFANVMRHVRKAVNNTLNRRGDTFMTNKLSSSMWPLSALTVLELHLTMDMIFTACRIGRALVTIGANPNSNLGSLVVNPGVANLPATMRTDLANKILGLREVYGSVWLQGNDPTGLQSSLLVFNSLLSRLLPEQNVHGV